MMNNNYCIIMAGGIGSRFWPVSRTNHPKQFIDILGTGESLIQQTFNRFKTICDVKNIFIVTNEEYKELTLEQLPELDENQVICEPSRRNTAPCIAYANFKIEKLNPKANIIVSPADHLILKPEVFQKVMLKALSYTEKHDDLLTIGINPSRPDTGYGYIKFKDDSNEGIYSVDEFTEKPELELAKKFISGGNYSWNSGMFIWRVDVIQNAMKSLLPEVYELFSAGKSHYNSAEEAKFIEATYSKCPEISIDYGVMEKAKNVKVINADFGWSDLGTWGSLYDHLELDKDGNGVIEGNVEVVNGSGNIALFPKNKKAVIQGVSDYIIVDTENAFLLCKKENEQEIKKFVEQMRSKGETKYL